MKQEVKPIKDSWVLKSVQQELLNNEGTGKKGLHNFSSR